MLIQNPILRGFNPDPSICRKDDDFYLAVSTFQWFPGVLIYHSRDLKNWRLAARPLDRVSQLDMRGVADSGGVWAPCLSYAKGRFHLVYTNVHAHGNRWRDTPNYVVTAESVEDCWSEPKYVNSIGFDPSLYHDADGRSYFLTMIAGFGRGQRAFDGIELQEYDPDRGGLVGEPQIIFEGTDRGATEGPHLFRKDGYYYLITAEGGTSYGHCETIARSRSLRGPYELMDAPFISAQDAPECTLQKTGHGQFIETPAGEWYFVHLCGRPLPGRKECPLGRETAIQKVIWTDGWPRLAHGGILPADEIEGPEIPEATVEPPPSAYRDEFSGDTLDPVYQSLRVPIEASWCSLRKNPSTLTLRGRESLNSCFDQSLIGRRVQSFRAWASTCLSFEPECFQHLAGLSAYYDTRKYYYLHLTFNDELGPVIDLLRNHGGNRPDYLLEAPIPVGDAGQVYLKCEIDYAEIRFYYALEEGKWIACGEAQDSGMISDESCGGGFTGSFFCLACQDSRTQEKEAQFLFFEYAEPED